MCSHTEAEAGLALSWAPGLPLDPSAVQRMEEGVGEQSWKAASSPRKIGVENKRWEGAREEVSWVRGQCQGEMERPRGQVWTMARV